MRIVIEFTAPVEIRRYVYSEMATAGLTQEHLQAAHVASWDAFTTILEFEVPEIEQPTQQINRGALQAQNAARAAQNERQGS